MIVVSVHDVSESHLDEVRWLLNRLDELGARPRVLKVVPGEGGAAFDPGGAFADLLRAEVADGAEVVLHGWDHRAAGPLRGGSLDRARARLFAPREAEFLTVTPGQAAGRVASAVSALAAAGITATGFCPPAWLAIPELPAVLRQAGLRYVVGMFWVAELRSGRSRLVLPFGYIGAGRGQERLVSAIGRASRLVAGRRPVRCFVHPESAARSASARRTLAQLAVQLRTRRAVTYAQLLG